MKKIFKFGINIPKHIIVLVIVNIIIFIVFSLLERSYFTYEVISSILNRVSEINILALGVTIVFISGGFDLSFGSIMGFTAVVCGMLYNLNINFGIAVIISILLSLFIGFLNGIFIVRLHLDAFIVTLAMSQIIRSIIYVLTGGNTISGFPNWFTGLSEKELLRIPILFILMVITTVLIFILLKKTILGRYIFATGCNEKAARISGINVDKIKFFVYIFAGFLSGVAGLVFASRVNSVPANTGLNVPLEVITAVVIGGTLISGGQGTVLGTTLGVIAMFVLLTGFNLLGISPYWEIIILGMIMILIVGYNKLFSRFRIIIKKRENA